MDSITSKLKMENKEVIHIVTEVVAFLGIIFYFSSQNKKLEKHIEDLSASLEEQTTKCTDLEEKLKKMSNRMDQLGQYCSQSLGELSSMMKDVQTKQVLSQAFETVKSQRSGFLPKTNDPLPSSKVKESKSQNRSETVDHKTIPVNQPVIEPLPKVSFILESDSESESEDELLDQEISEELSELQKTQ